MSLYIYVYLHIYIYIYIYLFIRVRDRVGSFSQRERVRYIRPHIYTPTFVTAIVLMFANASQQHLQKDILKYIRKGILLAKIAAGARARRSMSSPNVLMCNAMMNVIRYCACYMWIWNIKVIFLYTKIYIGICKI